MTPNTISIHLAPEAVRGVIRAAADQYGVSPAMVLSKHKDAPIVAARRMAAKILRDDPYRYSFPEIARFLGGRHHTTIMHLINSEATDEVPPARRLIRGAKGIVERTAGNIESRIAEIRTNRVVLQARIAELDGLEKELDEMLVRLRGPRVEPRQKLVVEYVDVRALVGRA